MIITNRIEQYNDEYVFFSESIKNNIIKDGYFIRIIYSNELFSLNGIYINIDFVFTYIEKYYNKIRCLFDINININRHFMGLIKNVEYNILKKVDIKNKTPQYKLYDQIKSGEIKIYDDNVNANYNKIVLKITGVWETSNQYGITYKFYRV